MSRAVLLLLPLFILSTVSFALPSMIEEEIYRPLERLPLAERNYEQLGNILKVYQKAAQNPWGTIPDSGILKIGTKSQRVLLLRERLKATNDLPPYYDHHNILFDEELAEAVKLFQTRHGLKADGVVGALTLRELNVPPSERVNQIETNMKRWALLSARLKNNYILVNIPDYKLSLFENDEPVLTMKAIVGKPTRPTPEIDSEVTTLVFNPYWNVPRRIARLDIVPKVIANPDYLDEMHIRIFDGQESNSVELNQDDIDWPNVSEDGINFHLRQDPGQDNALGLVKFEFQNTHDVYLHDTPAKNLFDEEKRSFSSGCVRLEQPFELVTYLMQNKPNWDEDQLQDILASGKTTYIKTAHPIPIFITYITAWVDEDGRVNFRDDIYGKDHEFESNVYSNNDSNYTTREEF